MKTPCSCRGERGGWEKGLGDEGETVSGVGGTLPLCLPVWVFTLSNLSNTDVVKPTPTSPHR